MRLFVIIVIFMVIIAIKYGLIAPLHRILARNEQSYHRNVENNERHPFPSPEPNQPAMTPEMIEKWIRACAKK